MKKRLGFTIVELLVVIAILGILLGIISVAVMGSLKNGRAKRANTMRAVVEQAIATYYAQEGKWPSKIESVARNMGNKTKYVFSPSETDDILYEIVKGSVGANATRPLLDASALFVADKNKIGNSNFGCFDNHGDRTGSDYCGDKHCINGIDFTTATQKSSKKHIALQQMAFGYQGSNEGKFCRFWLTYNGRTDAVSVSLEKPDESEEEN